MENFCMTIKSKLIFSVNDECLLLYDEMLHETLRNFIKVSFIWNFVVSFAFEFFCLLKYCFGSNSTEVGNYLNGIYPLGWVNSDKWRYRLFTSLLLMGVFHTQLITDKSDLLKANCLLLKWIDLILISDCLLPTAQLSYFWILWERDVSGLVCAIWTVACFHLSSQFTGAGTYLRSKQTSLPSVLCPV